MSDSPNPGQVAQNVKRFATMRRIQQQNARARKARENGYHGPLTRNDVAAIAARNAR